MPKPRNNTRYECKNGKTQHGGSGGLVSGRFCKNNCDLYKAKKCKRWLN